MLLPFSPGTGEKSNQDTPRVVVSHLCLFTFAGNISKSIFKFFIINLIGRFFLTNDFTSICEGVDKNITLFGLFLCQRKTKAKTMQIIPNVENNFEICIYKFRNWELIRN